MFSKEILFTFKKVYLPGLLKLLKSALLQTIQKKEGTEMFENTLIQSDQHWAIWAVLISVAAFGLWAEKTRWGSRLSAVVVSILAAFILSNLSIIPSQAEGYDVVWSYLVPLAIPLLLFKADLRMIVKEAGPTLLAFTFGPLAPCWERCWHLSSFLWAKKGIN